jgi:hypothetical protein
MTLTKAVFSLYGDYYAKSAKPRERVHPEADFSRPIHIDGFRMGMEHRKGYGCRPVYLFLDLVTFSITPNLA